MFSFFNIRKPTDFTRKSFLAKVEFKLPLKDRKTIELVDIYFYASSIMRFNPPPSLLYGTLKGQVRLIKIIKFKFEKDYEVEI